MAFNENTRVKIPAILHLCRLGYQYLSLSDAVWDEETNIFTNLFSDAIKRLNPGIEEETISRQLQKISLALDNEDLGQAFYKMLLDTSEIKLLDFSSPDNFTKNNSFHVVTELPCINGEDEFRPDITLLVNGMPLAFIEVKKPNNKEGILQERTRINRRFQNRKFRKFINISQLLVFSNNMEYDSDSIEPIQGAFYSTTSHNEALFNCFREEENPDLNQFLAPESEEVENFILRDNNLITIKHSPEFLVNKDPHTPTNRILISLFCRERLAVLLKYGIAYVKTSQGIEKHIMRYPQLFATKAIEKTLNNNIKKGIIWHTQGSGKTALAFFNVRYLTDYFSRQGIIPKFYFIVDRLDLMIQAAREFTSRGLIVHTVNSKQALVNDFKTQKAIHNLSGQQEITVVNIQKFKDETTVLHSGDYDISYQRIYFLDEVHRSYNPTGSFLANLFNSDRDAIMIGLTGTPLIKSDRRSRDIFGDYIHKYYYNSSIADGYTLKLIREGIETKYKMELEQTLQEIEVLKGDLEKKLVFSHPRFVEPMLKYILDDFSKFRVISGDKTVGAMVVCESSEQAKALFALFRKKFPARSLDYNQERPEVLAAETYSLNNLQDVNHGHLKGALVLHDVDTKDERKEQIEAFKEGDIDFLFVFNMLLTGFDAKRLKKLYIARVIHDHNLLQTLTRVNRPYKEFHYGYVVDFADIRKEFDATNKAYFDELQQELGDEMESYKSLFKSKEEIEEEIKEIREFLFHYDLENAELFSRQISEINSSKQMLEIKKVLENAKNLYNILRFFGYDDLQDKIDFKKLNQLYNEASRRLDLLNLKESLANHVDTSALLNTALENVLFTFKKVSEQELIIADELKDMFRKTREALANNFDQQDPHFVSLFDELKRLFNKKNLDEINQEEMKKNMDSLQMILDQVTELNRKNNLLKARYENDAKYARIHKRMVEKQLISKRESEIRDSLLDIKQKADSKVELNEKMLDHESFFEQMMMQLVIGTFREKKITLDTQSAKFINGCIVKEYLNEFQGVNTW